MEQRTIEIIKSFGDVSKKMLFIEGDVLAVTNAERSIVAIAKLPEQITKEFALYDVSEFLGTYSLFNTPTLEFKEDFVLIADGKNKAKYYYSSKLGITNIYGADIDGVKGDELATFTIEKSDLDTAKKASSVLGLIDLQITDTGVKVVNTEANKMGNEFEIHVSNFNCKNPELLKDGEHVLFLTDLVFIPDTYDVTIYENITQFKAANGDVNYYVAYKEFD